MTNARPAPSGNHAMRRMAQRRSNDANGCSASKRELKRMERCRDMLNMVIINIRNRRVATAESVALISQLVCRWLCRNMKIGRHMMAMVDNG